MLLLDWSAWSWTGTSVAFLICITFLFFIVCSSLRTGNINPKKCYLPPGPTPWPIVGSLISMLRNRPHFRWVLGVAEGKDITCIRLGRVNTIIVNSPELACEFLKKHDASFASRPLTMATEYAGGNYRTVVLTPWGNQWKKMRRVVATVLSPATLRQQQLLRLEEADHLTLYVYNVCKESLMTKKTVIDIRLTTRYYSGNAIRRMIFGQRSFWNKEGFGMPGKEEIEYTNTAFTILSLIYAFNPSDFIPWLRWFDYDGHERIVKEAIKVLYRYHEPIVYERVKRWRDADGACEVEDLLDTMISLNYNDGNPMLTVEEIKAQFTEFIFAAIDNPSNTVEWALAHLLDQPNILQKAVEELDRVVGKDRLVQESDFPQLPYIKACAREALRLHPVAPFNLPHVALNDTTVSGYFIPKGSQILLSRVGLGRNPKVWHNPLHFDPERHLKEDSMDVELAEPNLRFISFTTGRRGCMGSMLGSLMTYMLLARLIQAFEWSLAPGETRVDLSENKWSLFMAEPLKACATPRLTMLLEQI